MKINYESKYKVGQTLYYIENNEVKEATIVGISVKMVEGSFYRTTPAFEEFYTIKESDTKYPHFTEKNLEDHYFADLKSIAVHIMNQIL